MTTNPHHDQLIRLFQKNAAPLPITPTNQTPQLPPKPKPTKAILFDIYGTLITSAAGDISLAQPTQHNNLIRQLITQAGLHWRSDTPPENPANQLNQQIQQTRQQAKNNGIPYPEINIETIWTTLLQRWTQPTPDSKPTPHTIQKLAIQYECAVNPVSLNPHCRQTLTLCQNTQLPLGIISNAQFYTPIMLEALLGEPLQTAGFHPQLQTWSYQEQRGKPDTTLFHKTAHTLQTQLNIHPNQTLYIGNDMLNDIWAATQTGFNAVLYAGDNRSLRLRQNDNRCHNLKPYATITTLTQIQKLLP